jgi:hypothetical protein
MITNIGIGEAKVEVEFSEDLTLDFDDDGYDGGLIVITRVWYEGGNGHRTDIQPCLDQKTLRNLANEAYWYNVNKGNRVE